jgi:MoxR-like ATPase
MQRAEVVFLDEVFNASSAILNALLTFMNERKFHDRGVVYPTPLKMLFGATNHAPREEGLGAVYDRFLLRCRMENAPAGHDALSRLLSAAWTETHSHADAGQGHFKDLPGTLQTYRDTIETMTTEGKLVVDPLGKALPQLAAMVAMVRAKELSEMSNRRLVKFSAIVLAEALLRSAQAKAAEAEVLPRDLGVILTYGLDQGDPGALSKMRQDLLLA